MKKLLLSVAMLASTALAVADNWPTSLDEAIVIKPYGESCYSTDLRTTSDGLTYIFFQGPNASTIEQRLQVVKPDGSFVFPEGSVTFSAEDNISYLKVNDQITIDNDDNAIIAVSDLRYGTECYTIYKFDQEGEEIWHTSLNNGKGVDGSNAHISIACTEDGGYVFAYMTYSYDESVPTWVTVEKLNNDGTVAWDEPLVLKSSTTQYAYPAIVDAGSSQVILTYSKGSGQDLMARMIDFDGSSVWGDDDLVLWQGGFSSNPLHTMISTIKGPDGGALMAWMDPDALTSTYENRISYIMNDGTYGFATGDEGTNISNNSDYSRGLPKMYYDENEKAIYCVWQQFDQSYQSYHGLYMQKMSLDGELLWGADGKAVVEMQDENTYSYCSIKGAGNGQFAVFYMKLEGLASNGPVSCFMQIYDADGNMVGDPVEFAVTDTNKTSLWTSDLIDGSYFIYSYEDNDQGYYSKAVDYMSKINLSEATAIHSTKADKKSGNIVRQDYFSLDGRQLSQPSKGVNIVRKVYSDNSVSTERIVK